MYSFARSPTPSGPVFSKARGLRPQSLSWGTRLSRAPTPPPLPPLCQGRGLSGARAPLSLLPIDLCIPERASRVQSAGRKRHAVGGGLLVAPAALCGSPVLTQGKAGGPVEPAMLSRDEHISALTPIAPIWFLAPLADIASKVGQGLHAPQGEARFV